MTPWKHNRTTLDMSEVFALQWTQDGDRDALLVTAKAGARVMLYGSDPPGRPFRDGFLTSRNTFQKYFTQAEFKDRVEQVLHQEAFMVGPGVAFIFVDKEAEQRFSAGRFRRRDLC